MADDGQGCAEEGAEEEVEAEEQGYTEEGREEEEEGEEAAEAVEPDCAEEGAEEEVEAAEQEEEAAAGAEEAEDVDEALPCEIEEETQDAAAEDNGIVEAWGLEEVEDLNLDGDRMSAAQRFLQGDTNYMDSAGTLEEEQAEQVEPSKASAKASVAKRRRLG
uniref:Uncharacterized protein n=1 Tax=Pyrodinium bahamense TaxID=73915 RepID=A0A7S0FY74_9DINO